MSNQMIIERAKSAEMSHDYATAARLYKELLLHDSTNAEYLSALGRIYINAGEDKKAIPYFEQIHTFHPEDINSMTALGGIFRRLGRYEDSTAILYKALETGKDNLNVSYNLGFTLKEMKNYEDAIDAFENVIAMNPRDVLTHNHLGSIYYETNELDKAVAAYKRGLQIDPNHPILNYNLARTYRKQKNYPDAVRCYETALKTRPNWPEAITEFSRLLIKCQKSEEAARIVKQSIKIHPNNPDLLYSLGQVYLNQFDYDNAKKTLKQANAVKSNDVKILTALSAAYEKADESEKALDTILNAIDLEPLNNDVRMQYVDTLLSVNDYNSAFMTIESLDNETKGRDVHVMDLYGQYYITQGQDEKAEQYFNRIEKTDHHYKDYMLGASKRYSQLEKYDDAEKYARNFVKVRENRPEGYNMLGKIYTKTGNLELAREAYEKGTKVRRPNVLARKGMEDVIRLQSMPGDKTEENAEDQIKAENQGDEITEAEITNDEILDEDFDFTSLGDNEDLEEPVDEMTSIADQLEDDDFDIFDDMDEDEADGDTLPAEELMDAIGSADSQEPENTLKAEGNEDFEEPELSVEEIPLADEVSEDDGLVNAGQSAAGNDFSGEAALSQQDNLSLSDKALDALSSAQQAASQALQLALDAEKRVGEMEEKQKEFEAKNEERRSAEEKTGIKDDEGLEESKQSEDFDLDEELTPANQDEQEPADFAEEAEQEESAVQTEPDEESLEGTEVEEAEAEEESEATDSEEIDENANPDEVSDNEGDEGESSDEIAAEEDISLEGADEIGDNESQEFARMPEDNSNFDDQFNAELEENLDTTPFTSVIELYAELLAIYGDIDDSESQKELSSLAEKIEAGEISAEEAQESEKEADNFQAPAELPASGMEDDKEVQEVAEMLSKIEAILSDDELALKYSKEISMLKRLKTLCEYLPAEEKVAFASGRIRMLMDYLLSKMSGKPGLLLTTQSLLKSGILGNEYRVQLISECEDELNNELIRRVLIYMKKLAESLEDFGLAAALRACADGALEKIEMKNQKSQIF